MSIEAALEANTKAIVANTKALDEQNARLADLKPAATKTTDTPKADDKAPAAKPAARKPRGKAAAKKSDAPAELTAEKMTEATREFLGLDDDADARAERMTFLKAILSELGLKSLFTAEAVDRPRILGWIEQYKANPGEKVNFDGDEGTADADAVADEESDLLGG